MEEEFLISVAAPIIRNGLSEEIKNIPCITTFKKKLKTLFLGHVWILLNTINLVNIVIIKYYIEY
jgi:hypothetical protein